MGSDEICCVVGARPNYIKAWPILQALERQGQKAHVVHSGQHYDPKLADSILREIEFPEIDSQMTLANAESASVRFSSLHRNFTRFFSENKFSTVFVFGDVNTTLAAALASRGACKRLVHVEAGLRSHDVTMPEEVNRIIVDNLSDVLIATEQSALDNLAREGFPREHVHLCGNPMIETLIRMRAKWAEVAVPDQPYSIVTVHRAETIYQKQVLESLMRQIIRVSEKESLLFPLHPATHKQLLLFDLMPMVQASNIRLTGPMSYLQFIGCMNHANGVLTDSGGVQEEAVFLKKPLLTIRQNTERPITVDTGFNKLCPLEYFSAEIFLDHIENSRDLNFEIPLWDDGVSDRILAAVADQ